MTPTRTDAISRTLPRHGARKIRLGSLLLALAVSVALPGAGGQPISALAQAVAPAQTTALVVSATNAAHVMGSDGLEHVAYDLIFTNAFSAPVTLTTIEVLAPDESLLLRLAGEELKAVTQPLYGFEPTDQVLVSGVTATFIELTLAPDRLPARVSNRIAYDLPPSAPALIDSRQILGPPLEVGPAAQVVIAPPLRGTGWFNANGCCGPSFHRPGRLSIDGARYNKPEAFAIDWLRLQDNSLFSGNGGQPSEWYGFGAEIVAVGDGTVAFVNDGMPEGIPFELPTALGSSVDYAGNQVVIQIRPDVWAIYAHLQPGSIKVQPGDRVATGQPIATLGNTGNSFAPHLHFQLSDGPALMSSNSVPFALDGYTIVGEVDPLTLAAAFIDPSAFSRLPVAAAQHPQAGTLPLMASVVEFP